MKKHILRWLGGVALGVTATLGVTGCTDDFGQGHDNVNLGEKKHATLSVPLGSSNPVQASRSDVNFAQDAMVKIDCYWIGIFDAETHELLGTKWDNQPRKDDGTRWTVNNESVPYTVDGIEIEYYENSPYAYILGVVNYRGVKAKNVGEDTAESELIDLLTAATTFEDVTKIVIDTKSADEANRARGSDWTCPVMMGYYSTAKTVIHPQLNPDGSIFVSNLPDMTGSGYVSPTAVRASLVGSDVDFNLSEGSIRLQRLLAEVNVYITSPYGSNNTDYNNLQIESMRYRVINKPNEMYLMERATAEYASKITDKDEFLSVTPNSADFSGNYSSDENWTYVYGGYNSSVNAYLYQFRYQHYENKHYGQMFSGPLDGKNFHSVREQRFEDVTTENGFSNVFRMLCPSLEQDWNNYASYIELEITFNHVDQNLSYDSEGKTWGYQSKSGGTITYYIHEGCTSWPDGQAYQSSSPTPAVGDPKMRDFQTVRNTQYHYYISIGGTNGLQLNVEAKDMDNPEDGTYHNDGITGSAWYVNLQYLNNSNSTQYYEIGRFSNEVRKNLEWVYQLYDPSIHQWWYWGNFTGSFNGTNTTTGNWSSYNYNYIAVNDRWMYNNSLKSPDEQSFPIPEELRKAVKVLKTYDKESDAKTLEEFIAMDDDDPWLDLGKDKSYWIVIEPWNLSGDNIDYDQYTNYERMFCIFTPSHKDQDGCEIKGNTMQYLQRAYDSRVSLGKLYASKYGSTTPSNHDYSTESNHSSSYFDYTTYWCGAPGTVTWFYLTQYYNSDDSYKEVPNYQITVGNETYFVPREAVIVDDSYSTYKYLRVPLFIPEMGQSGLNQDYGYLNVDITPIPTPSKYRPYSERANSYDFGFYMQRKRNSKSNSSGTWQWLFEHVSESTFGFNKIYDFYNESTNYYKSFEFGGLTVVNNSSDNPRYIQTANVAQSSDDTGQAMLSCLSFQGGAGSNSPGSNRSNDKLMLKFWVDRPGDIYLSYGYGGQNSSGTPREWRAYWRSLDGNTNSGNKYLHWTPSDANDKKIVEEEKGQLISGSDILVDFWPPVASDGRFEKPLEVCIYMASSGGYIRSIEFRPFDIPLIADPVFPMTPITTTVQP